MRKKLIQLIRGTQSDQKQGAILRIITINIAIFSIVIFISFVTFLFSSLSAWENIISYLSLPSRISVFLYQPWSLLTFQFLHSISNPFHILFNMLWLYWFGRIFNFYFGNWRVWFLYLTGGMFGGILFIISYNIFPVFAGQSSFLIGASAGISAIVIALAVYMPNFEVFTLFGPIALKWIALITILFDIALAPNGFNAGGHIAHLGGALWGMFFMLLYKRDFDLSQWLPFQSKHKHIPKVKILTPQSLNSKGEKQKPSQQEIDRILDKIAEQGYDKLTQEEKQTLFDASQE